MATVCRHARSSVADGSEDAVINKLASLGNWGKHPNNEERDLHGWLKSVLSVQFEPYTVYLDLIRGGNLEPAPCAIHVALPFHVLTDIYNAGPEQWDRSILGGWATADVAALWRHVVPYCGFVIQDGFSYLWEVSAPSRILLHLFGKTHVVLRPPMKPHFQGTVQTTRSNAFAKGQLQDKCADHFAQVTTCLAPGHTRLPGLSDDELGHIIPIVRRNALVKHARIKHNSSQQQLGRGVFS